MLKPGVYIVFSWNGKDLFLQDLDGVFEVLSFNELSHDIRCALPRWQGRKLIVDWEGKLDRVLTVAEMQEKMDRIQHQITIRRDISGIEAMPEVDRPEYVRLRLKELWAELAKYEDLDPTATTLDAVRANESVTHETFDPKKGQ